MIKNFLVVCEGETDPEILKSVIDASGDACGDKFRTKTLFPGDRFTGRAGWGGLKKWCKRVSDDFQGMQLRVAQAASLRPAGIAIAQNGPIAQYPNASDKLGAAMALRSKDGKAGIVFQLDTDVVEDMLSELVLPNWVTFPLNAADREMIAESVMKKWLGNLAVKHKDKIIYCMTTHAMEAWILACHPVQDLIAKGVMVDPLINYDNIRNPDQALILLNYSVETKNGKKKLRKTVPVYKVYGDRIQANFSGALARSHSLTYFSSELIAY